MDDDIVDVLIVLGILGVGILGGIILLIRYEGLWHRIKRLLCREYEDHEEEEKKKKHKRTTIVVARKNNVVAVEECKKKIPIPLHVPIQRKHDVFEISHETPLSPIAESNEPTPKTAGSDQKTVFIFNAGKHYKAAVGDAATSLSSKTHVSTQSTYLPNQLAPIKDRRNSMMF